MRLHVIYCHFCDTNTWQCNVAVNSRSLTLLFHSINHQKSSCHILYLGNHWRTCTRANYSQVSTTINNDVQFPDPRLLPRGHTPAISEATRKRTPWYPIRDDSRRMQRAIVGRMMRSVRALDSKAVQIGRAHV